MSKQKVKKFEIPVCELKIAKFKEVSSDER